MECKVGQIRRSASCLATGPHLNIQCHFIQGTAAVRGIQMSGLCVACVGFPLVRGMWAGRKARVRAGEIRTRNDKVMRKKN